VTYSIAHIVDVSIERKCTINGDAKTLNAFRYSDQIGTECNSIDKTFSSLSRTGADDNIASDLSGCSVKPFSANI